ncbi:MFS transporter [Pseudomonas sp.]|uniref:MFS transporter n=1 Tax=Pseudomonas sp. TaxID=306 RepID=UPI00260CB0F6|nr:MFS transporter [Pseudomonas sp.]
MKPVNAVGFIVLGLFGLYTLEFGVVGILPMVMERFAVSTSHAGLLMGMFALTVAALGPGLVLLSSRLHHKKILVVSLSVFTLSSLFSGFTHDFNVLLTCRMIAAVFHPMFYTAALASAIALYPPERSAHAVSRAVIGTTLGLILGVPAMTWFAYTFSYEAAWLFCAGLCFLAGLGLLMLLPPSAPRELLSHSEQLSILRKPALWLNLTAAIFIFTALFSVYSYASEYLQRQVGLSPHAVGLLLVVFGIGGIVSNLWLGRLLDSHLVRTTFLQPLALAIAYLLLYTLASPWLPGMTLIMLVWGAAHTCGLVSSQVWLSSVSREAPDFATSLFITAANIGVLLGSSAGGWAINRLGLTGAVWSGVVFCVLAMLMVAIKVVIYGSRLEVQVARVSAT